MSTRKTWTMTISTKTDRTPTNTSYRKILAFNTHSPNRPPSRQPERLLLTAILERAFNDLYDPKATIKQAALDWFMSSSTDVASANYVCDVLNIDIDRLRARILSHHTIPRASRKQQIARHLFRG